MAQTQETRGAAGTATAGNDQNTYEKEPIVSQAIKSPWRVLDVINISDEVTPEDAQWAADNLADLPIRFLPHDSDTESMDNGDGTEWRDGFDLDVVTLKTGERVFRVLVPRGASTRDLEYADRVVMAAKKGAFLNHGWHQAKDQNGAPRFRFAMWVKHNIEANRMEAFACAEPLCKEHHGWHSDVESHEAAYFGSRVTGCKYEVIVQRLIESDEPWRVEVYVTDMFATPEQAGEFIAVLQKAQEACERANAALAAVTS